MSSPRDLVERGKACELQNDFAAAIGYYDQAIALYHNDCEDKAYAYSLCGRAYKSQNNFVAAIECCTNAIALLPDDVCKADAYFIRGQCYFKQENDVAALEDFAQALALYPDTDIEKCHVYFNCGIIFHAQKNFDKAIENMSRAFLLNPSSFSLEHLKNYDQNFPAFYQKIKNLLPLRTRLYVCYEGGVPEGVIPDTLIDKTGGCELMNKPMLLLCCQKTFDEETLQNLVQNVCPCCRAPIQGPVVNRFAHDVIEEFVKKHESLAAQKRNADLAAVKRDTQEEKKDESAGRHPSSNSNGFFRVASRLNANDARHSDVIEMEGFGLKLASGLQCSMRATVKF